MIKKLSYIFVLVGLSGFLTLIPGVFDKAVYWYFRAVEGSTIVIGDDCITLPYGWVIDSTDSHKGHALFNLRRKTEDGYLFVSVVFGTSSIIDNQEALNPVKAVPGLYSVYELAGLAPTNTVRYWSIVPDENLVIMGRDVDLLIELSTVNWSEGC